MRKTKILSLVCASMLCLSSSPAFSGFFKYVCRLGIASSPFLIETAKGYLSTCESEHAITCVKKLDKVGVAFNDFGYCLGKGLKKMKEKGKEASGQKFLKTFREEWKERRPNENIE